MMFKNIFKLRKSIQRIKQTRGIALTSLNMNDSTAHEKGNRLVTSEARTFLQNTHDLMVEEALVRGTDTNNKVLDYKSPEQLKETLDLTIEDTGADNTRMLEVFSNTIQNSVQSAHPHYFNQLYNGRNIPGLAASWVVEASKTNVHTFECAPVFTITEQYVIQKVNEKIGYQDGDGVFFPGGSMCNFNGMHLARFIHDKTLKQRGLTQSARMIIFTTSDAHYSVAKGAHFLGFGTENVVNVDTDDDGKMIPDDLQRKIRAAKDKGHIPLCVCATSGTTVLGAFDPLDELADICKENNTWLHVDACWGGGVLFSEKHKHLMKGIERTDSVAISFHKMLGVQLQCAGLMVRQKGLLNECNTTDAAYLFQPDKHYDQFYDVGMMTVQCGRKADGYKLWALWKSMGNTRLAEMVDSFFEHASYLKEQLDKRSEYMLVHPKFEYVNVCFWYIPPSLRVLEQTPEWWNKVSRVAPTIRKRMIEAGTLAIGYNPLVSKGFVNFFRIILDNPILTHADLDFVLDEIDRLGKDL